ncbi:SDR family oxidoreductase [Limobrevibacterium gyesilva]|uniref:SDR family oxidoreductase n=1 Tax=Limobrevibacterium gyesilva TaxID=2991712 RepID=A0AA41YQ48_9PROT|nr:SDR family oxidoreductase [Limobrevibacterium gyesilva]MCW3476666.1 SDR family oxidoreductase [Limobrevibacterium gyesilva]
MSGHGSRIAMVTGAGSGVGRAAALALLAEGYSVVLAGRRLGALEETIALAGDNGRRALAVPTDVTDPASVTALFAATHKAFGRLDLLFNNAGGNVPSTNFGDMTWEQWASVVAVNLNGAFLVANAAFRMMRDQSPRGGRIINNGSISAHTPRPGSAAYTATKHAITGLTKTISLDGRAYDIACGQIDIGNAASPMTARMAGGVPQADGTMKPEPTMNVDSVGRTIVYMAGLPPDANVMFLTVMATKMPFAGRG